MGGPKKAQRTKGNARPSSSGRSAELLSASGLTGFVGFNGLGDDYVPPTGQNTNDDVDTSVDGAFRLVLRKLTKRDNTTRLKALQELSDLIKEKDVDVLKGALPFWPRLYNKLALDNDRRVREATQRAHEQLCLKAKRNLAPYAKAVVGAWLLSLCDPLASAALAARAAFVAAFPSADEPRVLAFFSREIFAYCSDMILVQVPTSLPDSKDLPKEEQDAKYLRCLACALQAVQLVVERLSPLPDSSALSVMLGEEKFWKIATHPEATVRKCWYGLMACVCQCVPQLASEHAEHLSRVTLNSLAEAEPVVMVAIWETSLALLSSVPDCWQHVNARKVVLPQLWRVLKGGGMGCATHVCPILLPLLSILPVEVVGDAAAFYGAVFSSLREGLCNPKVENIPSERNAIVQAYMECLRYSLTRSLEPEKRAVRESLLKELCNLLDMSLMGPKSSLTSSTLYHHVAEFHAYCLRQSTSTDPSQRSSFVEIVTTFWDHVYKVGLQILSSDPLNIKWIRCFAELIKAIHNPSEPKLKKRVTIALPSEEGRVDKATKPVPHLLRPPSILEDCLSILNYTTKLASVAVQRALSSRNDAYVQVLACMLHSASSDAFVEDLLQELNVVRVAEHTAAFQLLETLRPLLEAKNDGESEMIDHVVDCLLIVSSSARPDEVVIFLDSVLEIGRPAFAVVLEKSLVCWESQLGIKKWLQAPRLAEQLVELAKQLIPTATAEASDIEYVWRILRAAIGTANMCDTLISSNHLSAVLGTIQKSLEGFAILESDGKKDLWQAVSFVCDVTLTLFSTYQGCGRLASSGDLVHMLFLLDCQNAAASGVGEKVRNAWQQAVRRMVHTGEGDSGTFWNISRSIHAQLLSDLSSTKCNVLIECASTYLETICYAMAKDDPASWTILVNVMQTILPSEDDWKRLVERHSLLDHLSHHLKVRNKKPYLVARSYCGKYSTACVPGLKEVATVVENILGRVLALHCPVGEKYEAQILSALDFLLLAKCLSSSSGESNSCGHAANDGSSLVSDESVLGAFLRAHEERLFHKLIDRIVCGEPLWLEALSYFLEIVSKADAMQLCSSYLQVWKESLTEKEATMAVVQVLLPHCQDSQKRNVFSVCLARLLCWDPSQGCAKAFHLVSLIAKAVECVKAPEDVVSLLYFLQGIRGSHPHVYLRDEAEATTLTDDEQEFSTACCLLLAAVVTTCPETLEPVNWDFILLSLAMWIQKLNWKQSISVFSTSQLIFAYDLLALFLRIASIIDEHQTLKNLCKFPENIVTEWKEFYAESIFSVLLPGFISMTGAEGTLNDSQEMLLSMLSAVLASASEAQVLRYTECSADDQASLNALLSKLMPLMISKSCAVQLGCSKVLEKIIPSVAKVDAELLHKCQEEASRPPPGPLLSMLQETGHVVDSFLLDFHIGDCCIVQPKSDSYTYTLGYLLSWSQLLLFFGASPAEARSEYAAYLQEMGLLAHLLRHLFCLMPENICLTRPASPGKGRTMFTEAVAFTPAAEDWTSVKLQHVACQTYLDAISKLPALVRSWWNGQSKRIMDHVERFTSRYVSRVICSRELQAVQRAEVTFKNMTVKARPVAREVVATHTIEGVAMELIVRLPTNHPLGAVTIESGRRVGVGNQQWRHWLLQLTTFLTHQNGSILDGLALWKRNIDKRFEGIEECMICFYVLHGSTCQLPSLSCRICKKRFHSACLFKWFSTSNNSTCPLCRNIF